jgi:urease accessory protein
MIRVLITLAFVLAPSLAFAHVGVGDTHGAIHGFVHPLTGIDHLLAMIGVGIFAAHLGGRAIWLVPIAFMTMMAVGGAFGVAGLGVPFVETGIGLSVVALGAIIAFRVGLPLPFAMAVVGFFALFHGHAHGAEMPRSASGLAYGFGFVAATGVLHLSGIALAFALRSLPQPRFVRFSTLVGAAMALAGLGVLAGAI